MLSSRENKKLITTSYRIWLSHHVQRRIRYELCSFYRIRKSQNRNISKTGIFNM